MKYSKILAFVLLVSYIGYCSAAAYDLDGDGIADAWSTGRWKADWNGDGIIDHRDPWVTGGARPVAWHDDWVVRDGWNGAWDRNGDGIIDWRDDWWTGSAQPWEGSWVRADWNRDGVIDWQDGWRRAGNDWVVDGWDSNWVGNGWHPETVSVREVPAGGYRDTEWRSVEGPWDTWGWGGARLGDWNGDGWIDSRDDWAWRDGFRGDWNRDGVIDWKDRVGRGSQGVRVREVPAGTGAKTTKTSGARPTTTSKPATTGSKTGTTSTAKPAQGSTTKSTTSSAAKPSSRR